MKTLIIIDVQNDFMPEGPLEVPDGNLIIPVINRIIPSFDLILATQDWHPKDHTSFASNHFEKKPFEKLELHGSWYPANTLARSLCPGIERSGVTQRFNF